MNTNSLNDKIQKYKDVLNAIRKARQQWQEKTKALVKKTLETIKGQTDLDWCVGINDEKINHETVYLAFGNQLSGIDYNSDNLYNIQEDKRGILIKHGGSLNFSLVNNGRLLTWISYPYILDIIAPSDIKILQSFNIDQIDEQTIVQQVEKFLDEMIRWEKNAKEEWPQVGFKNGKTEEQE